MTTLKSALLNSGTLTFNRAVEPKPETRETMNTVTVVNVESPGVPAHYEATFMINATFENMGIEHSNYFHWNCVVPEQSDRAQYRLVEDRAARLIAPMLRALADKIESDLPDFAQGPSR